MKDRKIALKSRLILYSRGRILLLQQTKPNGGNYTLVGGNVENGETVKEAVVRESYEEAGLILSPEDLKLVHVLQKSKNGEQRLTFYFKATEWTGQLQAREKTKFQAAEWFYLDNLPPNMTESAQQVLLAYRKGVLYSELSLK